MSKSPTKSESSLSEIVTAAFWIREGVPKTSCERASPIPELDNAEVYFKKEYRNPSGSFNDRGARYALLRLSESQKNSGVITTSTGNHAIALAYHGHSLGIPVSVLLPKHTSPAEIRMYERYCANTRVESLEEHELREKAAMMEKERGLTFVDENDNPNVASGHGTMGLEIIDQLEGLDAVIVPANGGSRALLDGTYVAVKTLNPSVSIIAVTSEKNLDCKIELDENEATTVGESKQLTLEKGSGNSERNECPSKCANPQLVDKCVSVKQDDIALAVLRLVEYEKVIVEPNGALRLAALIGGYLPELKGQRVVVVLSEGNVDSALLPRLIARGLTTDGRLVRFEVQIDDRLGTMATLLRMVTSTGAIIKDAIKEQSLNDPSVSSWQANVLVEVRDRDHARQLKSLLDKNFLVTFWSSKIDSMR